MEQIIKLARQEPMRREVKEINLCAQSASEVTRAVKKACLASIEQVCRSEVARKDRQDKANMDNGAHREREVK